MSTYRRQRTEWLEEQAEASKPRTKSPKEYSGLVPRRGSHPKRNKKCPCGSGQKFKLCCDALAPVPYLPVKQPGTPTPDKTPRKQSAA